MRSLVRLALLVITVSFSFVTHAKEVLRVGVYPKYPPLAYHDKEGLTGIDVAAAEVMGQQLDRKVKFVEMDFAKLIPALEAGEIDIIMSGMTITAARSQQVSFSNPYLDAGQMAIIRYADAGRLSFRGALFRPGTRVAVQANTTGEEFAKKTLKTANITAFDSINEGFALLKSGQVDFLVHDAATSWSLATDRKNEDLLSLNHQLTEEKLGWAVQKNNAALLNAVNEQLAIMQRNGMLRAIIRKWVPVTVEVQDSMVKLKPASQTISGNKVPANSQPSSNSSSVSNSKK